MVSRRGLSAQKFTCARSISTSATAGQTSFTNVSGATNIAGKRNAFNFRIDVASASVIPIVWALVYVPEGTQLASLNFNIPATSESGDPTANIAAELIPSGQWLIASGMVVSGAICKCVEKSTRILNNGDSIYFGVKPIDSGAGGAQSLSIAVGYSIRYFIRFA